MTEKARQPGGTATESRSNATPAQDTGGFGPVLRSKAFRRLLIAQSVSSLGDWVATFAFIAAAFALTKNQTSVAIVLVLRLVPPIFAAPVGGVVADRLPRRLIMVTADVSRAVLIALVPFVHIGLLYLIAFVHECISLFFLPARDASVPQLAPRQSLPEANGLILASSYGSLPIAAALSGGLFLVAKHIPPDLPFAHLFREHPYSFAFFFDAATFVFSASMLVRLRLEERGGKEELDLVEGVAEGVRYVLRHPGLRALASGLIVSMFGGGVLFAVGIAYIRRVMAGVQMLFRVGLGAGALGIGGLSRWIGTTFGELRLGFVKLDGNQMGMIVGGGLILLGAVAASGVRKSRAWQNL